MTVTTVSFTDRVATRAATFRPSRAALSVMAAPFYLVGLLFGLLWVAVTWCWAATASGVEDIRERAYRTHRETG